MEMNAKKSVMAGTLAAIAASVCCVGPLVLLTLGIGGAWVGNLAALEPYRPFFIALTLVFLGLAFRTLYLVPQRCAADAACAAPLALARQRGMFWIVTVMTLVLLATPALAAFFI